MRMFAVIAALLLVSASRAVAFEETVLPGVKNDVPGVTLEQDPSTAGLELSGTSDAGMEVQLPGFGTIGILPKLDFGLELLYGATARSDGDLPMELNAPEPQPNDLTVRGAIKNTF
jgi:hypothetical protein